MKRWRLGILAILCLLGLGVNGAFAQTYNATVWEGRIICPVDFFMGIFR